MKRLLSVAALIAAMPFAVQAGVAPIAGEDFDGGALNLNSSVVPALDGGAGDYFGVGSRNGWPQGFPPGVPFSLGDDTVISYSDPAGVPFPDDDEGIFGENSDLDNDYFALVDSDEFLDAQTASWEFDITGYEELELCIDMGGISNASFDGYSLDSDMVFSVSIDAGPAQIAFDVDAVDNPGFVTRPMDDGDPSGGGRLLEVSGDNAVSKLLAEDGSVAGDTYFDKTPASGPGAGQMDTFSTAINGTGTTLVLTLTANMPFEAAAFDNIVIKGTAPTPTEEKSWSEVKGIFRD